MNQPDFLYIGTSKAGSTWIYNLLNQHPKIFMAPGKGAYYFDNHFDEGEAWYLDHFKGAEKSQRTGEVSHSYLFSKEACRRIHEFNPKMKMLVCLRNPMDRAFSAYLDRVKNGRFNGSFEEALQAEESLVDRGRYATHLGYYLETFGRDNFHIADFGDIKQQPESFAKELFSFLEVDPLENAKLDLRKRMPAGKPRSIRISKFSKTIAKYAKRLGMRRMIGNVKKSVLLRNMLYRPYSDSNRPTIREETKAELASLFRPELRKLDQILMTDYEDQWLGTDDQA